MRPACAIMEGERRPAMTETIRSALLLIEAAPDAELTAASLAQALGYSPWHLQRLFARETGTSIAAHVLTRRLERALHAMAMGERGIDAALRWGFDTYAGFYKAFVRHYGCSPRAYLRLYPAPPAGNRMPMNTILTEAELRTLLAAWPQAAQLPITLLFSPEGSPRGDVWRVGNDLYLKQGPRSQLLRAALLAHALDAQGFPAALPVPTSCGEDLTPGDMPCLLLRRLPGDPLRAETCLSSPMLARSAGDALARLHAALRQTDIVTDELALPTLVRDWALPEVLRQCVQWQLSLPEVTLQEAADTLATLSPSLPTQLLHRDPCPGNVLTHGGAVCGFLDFDLTLRGPRLWDICYLTTGILSEADTSEDSRWLTLLDAVLEGYHAQSPLTPTERQAVWPMLCGITLVCMASFGHDSACQHAAEMNRAMLRSLLSWRTNIEQITHALP